MHQVFKCFFSAISPSATHCALDAGFNSLRKKRAASVHCISRRILTSGPKTFKSNPKALTSLWNILDFPICLGDHGIDCVSPQQVIYESGILCNGAFMPICIVWRQLQPPLDCGISGTRHKFPKEPICGTLMDLRGVSGSPKCSQEMNDLYWVLPVKRLVLHLNSYFLAHLLSLRCHSVIVSLRFADEMVLTAVNSLLLPFAY